MQGFGVSLFILVFCFPVCIFFLLSEILMKYDENTLSLK